MLSIDLDNVNLRLGVSFIFRELEIEEVFMWWVAESVLYWGNIVISISQFDRGERGKYQREEESNFTYCTPTCCFRFSV